MARSRWLGTVGAVVAVVSLVAACGGSHQTAVQIVHSASEKTVAAKTAHISVTVATTGGGLAQPLTEDGSFNFQTKTGTLSLDASSLGLPGTQGKIDTVIRFPVVWVHSPQLGAQLGGKQWLKIDVQALGQQQGLDLSSLVQSQSSDPSATLTNLKAVADVREVGKEKVRGVETTHYAGTVDMVKAKALLPAASQAAYQQLLDKLGTTSQPTDVWVDGEGRARRLKVQLDMSKSTVGGQAAAGSPFHGVVTTTEEFFDFGAKVTANPPPDDQAVDLTKLLQQFQAGGGG